MLALLAAAALAAAPDYRQPATWLCHARRDDVCAADVTATTVDANGTATRAPSPVSKPPEVDCFYVYPTVSVEPTPNSSLAAGPALGIAAAQFAAFRRGCRTFAPIYRQVTLTALRARLRDPSVSLDFDTAYADVRAAWHDYLAHDNEGRAFVLIGHSQGSLLLKRLVTDEIDGKPLQRQMLSAILPGTAVQVPVDKDVGGDFRTVALCRSVEQTGCVVTWASFRDTAPPPANALFGRSGGPGLEAGCVNPAALAGGRAPLDSVLGFPWWQGGVAIYHADHWRWPTAFVRLPGLLSGECVTAGNLRYLAVHVAAEPRDGLTEQLLGAASIGDAAYPDWGFHVVDINLVQGDLVRLVATQSAAWRSRHPEP